MPMPSDQGDVAGVEVTGPGRLRPWSSPRVILSEMRQAEFNSLVSKLDHPKPGYTSTGSATPS